MKVRTFTKKDVAVEIADRLEATLVDSLTFTDELFVVLRDMLTDDYEKVQEIFVPAHKKTHFKPGKILRQYLKQPLK